ncbi:MAG TPA: hypothetical protein VF212_01880 [Longimicrobiales bacterium]
MQFIRRFLARLRAWHLDRRSARIPAIAILADAATTIHRDVTSNGIRVYSLCGCCGARLNASATLCDECAQKQSRPARPF